MGHAEPAPHALGLRIVELLYEIVASEIARALLAHDHQQPFDLVFGKSLRNHDFTCGTKYALGNAAEPAPRFRESRAGGESRRRSLLSHEKFLGEHRGRIMARQSRALGDVRFVIGEWPSQEPANKACKSIATLVVIAHTLRM